MKLKLKQLLSIGLSTACIMASANLALANPTPPLSPEQQVGVLSNKNLKEPPKLDKSDTKYNYATQGIELKCGYQYSKWVDAITKVFLKSENGTWTEIKPKEYTNLNENAFFYVLLNNDGGIALYEYKEPAVKLTVRIKAKGYKTKEITGEKEKGDGFLTKFNVTEETTAEDEAPQPKEFKVIFKYKYKDNESTEIKIKETEKLTEDKIPADYKDNVDYWYVENDKDQKPYRFGESIAKDLTLVAKRKEYKVSFCKWNGDDIINPIKVKAGDKVENPNIANVLTWYTTQQFENGTEYKFDTPVTDDLNLFAKQEYKVTLQYKDKSDVVEITATANGARLEKKHYEKYEDVEYWYPKNDPNKKYRPQNLQFVNIYDNTTFIAKIKEAPTEHTVTFQYGNDSKTISVKHNEKVSAPDISGWKDSDDDQLEIKGWKNGNNGFFDFNTEITQDLTLTAEQQEKFTVTFKVDGIDNIPAQRVYKNKTVSAPQLNNVEIEKWHLNGTDDEFNFSTPITDNITIIGDKKEAAPPNNGGQQPQDPGDGQQNPGNGQQNPGDGQQDPGNGGQQDPGNGGQQDPGNDGQQDPGNGGQQDPGNDGQQNPGDGQQDPGDGQQDPGNGGQQDPGDGQQDPGDGGQQDPGNDGQQNPGDGQQDPGDGQQDPGDGQQPQDNGSDNIPDPFIPPFLLDFDFFNVSETTIDDNATPLSRPDDHSTEAIEDEDVILADEDEDSIFDDELPLVDVKKEDELEIDRENVPLSNIPKTSDRSTSIFYLSLTLMGGFFFSLFELLRKKISK